MIRSRQDPRWLPLHGRVSYTVAHTLQLEGHPVRALSHLERMVEAGVDSLSCWLLIARCKAATSSFDACERVLECAAAGTGGLAEKLHECCVYSSLGHFAEAECALAGTIEVFPSLSGVWLLRGDVAVARHRPADARRAYGEAIACDSWTGLDATAAQFRLDCFGSGEEPLEGSLDMEVLVEHSGGIGSILDHSGN